MDFILNVSEIEIGERELLFKLISVRQRLYFTHMSFDNSNLLLNFYDGK